MKDDYYKALAFFQRRTLSYRTIGLTHTLKRRHAKAIKQKQLRDGVRSRLKSWVRLSDIVKIQIDMTSVSWSTGVPSKYLLGETYEQ